MSTYLQITASNITQKAKFEDGTRLPIELWAICDEGEETSCLAGLVLHPKTKKLVRADHLPGFLSYHSDRLGSGFHRFSRLPSRRNVERQQPKNSGAKSGKAERPQVRQIGQKLAKKTFLSQSA